MAFDEKKDAVSKLCKKASGLQTCQAMYLIHMISLNNTQLGYPKAQEILAELQKDPFRPVSGLYQIVQPIVKDLQDFITNKSITYCYNCFANDFRFAMFARRVGEFLCPLDEIPGLTQFLCDLSLQVTKFTSPNTK